MDDVYAVGIRVNRIDGVSHATPVLVDIVRVRAPDSTESAFVLEVDVITAREDPITAGPFTRSIRRA